jgi:flagellar hook assembly protein FlgD
MRRFTSLIVDASGRRVRSVWQGALTGRTTTLQWDGRDDSGREVPAGVYLARLQGAAESVVARLVRTE